ncbi:MAG: hypothetical protein ABSB84_03375 [Verrucomicrobiota bacterium]
MPEKPQTETNLPAQPRGPGGGRRRGHRGGRGRGPRRTEQISQAGPPADAPALPERKIETPSSAISQAIEEVTQIVESLKQTLDQMEEVLELVELAERQKLADEREIESLRQALRKIQQPRGERRERSQQND